MLLGESSVVKQKGEGDEIDGKSSGVSPCKEMEMGAELFCFLLGECMALFAQISGNGSV
jgi:hypothetical protein